MTPSPTPGPTPGEDEATHDAVRGRRAGLTARFLLAVGEEVDEEGLTPAALTRAVVRVLPVDGVGVSSLIRELRMPLGSSSADSARAEELQTTLGEGPCLHAAQTESRDVFDLDDLKTRWPLYAEELLRQTPFRSVVSLPLSAPGHGVFAAFDLYTRSPRINGIDLDEVEREVAAPAAALLSTCIDEVRDQDVLAAAPGWYQSAAGRRHNAWVAIGIVMGSRNVRQGDVISLLRAHAYTQDRTLDDVAEDIVEGRLTPSELTT